MKSARRDLRDPRIDPAPRDALLWRTWIVTVTRVEPGIVWYTRRKLIGAEDPEAWQLIEKFRGWAKDAIVERREGVLEQCSVMDFGVAGPCRTCGKYLERDVHVNSEGLWCAEHCTASNHAKSRGKGAARKRHRGARLDDTCDDREPVGNGSRGAEGVSA